MVSGLRTVPSVTQQVSPTVRTSGPSEHRRWVMILKEESIGRSRSMPRGIYLDRLTRTTMTTHRGTDSAISCKQSIHTIQRPIETHPDRVSLCKFPVAVMLCSPSSSCRPARLRHVNALMYTFQHSHLSAYNTSSPRPVHEQSHTILRDGNQGCIPIEAHRLPSTSTNTSYTTTMLLKRLQSRPEWRDPLGSVSQAPAHSLHRS